MLIQTARITLPLYNTRFKQIFARPPSTTPHPPPANTHIYTPPPSEHFSWDYLHRWGLRAQCLRDGRGRKAFACWQQQQQRHSDTSLQPAGRTRLNPAGSRVRREAHWPGIWDVRLTLLNHSLETMSIRATPSSLFDIKAKEGGGGEDRRERGREGGGGWLEREAKFQSLTLKYQKGCEWMSQPEPCSPAAHGSRRRIVGELHRPTV